ncbi:MAG: MOP flippase family protein [Burkholderiaceae bacterium]|jgi:O-antigen/teichoic acid export membrane protein|nr:MOP flippase family protein [Burkholderiaceae bacterium]
MSQTPQSSIKDKAFSAVRWTTAGMAAGVVMKLMQVFILTRILTPSDYGVMAIVAAVLTFPWVINDTGMNSAYIHRRNVSDNERSSLFWGNVLFAVLLGGVVLAIAPLIAWIYGDARLFPLLALSSLTFLIVGLGSQYRLNAEKQLRFKPMAFIEIAAAIAGTATAVFTAMAGAGPYTLVFASLARSVVNTALCWAYLSTDWKPAWHLSWLELRPYLRFGVAAVSSAIIDNINRSLDVVVLGKFVPAVSLGLYSVPRNFVEIVQQLVNNIISRVGFPLISSVQHDRNKVNTIMASALNIVGALNAPLYVGMALFADPLVRVLFGAQWHGVGHLLALLCVVGYVRSMLAPTRGLLLGLGLARLELWWNLGILVITLPAIVFGAMHGPEWLAISLAAACTLLLLPTWYGVYRLQAGISLAQYAVLVLRPLALSVLCMLPAVFLAREVSQPLAQLAIAALTAAPLYLLLNVLLNRLFVDSVVRLLLVRRAPGGSRP